MLKIKIKRFLKEEDKKVAVTAGQLLSNFNKYKENKIWIIFDTETTGLLAHKRQITEIAAVAVDPENLNSEISPDNVYHKKVNLTDETKKRIEDEKNHPEIIAKGGKSIEEILKMTDYWKDDADRIDESDAMREFNDFINKISTGKEVVLVAHNATFDRNFVSVRSSKYGIKALNPKTMNSLVFAREVFYPIIETVKELELKKKIAPKGIPSFTLGSLSRTLDISNKNWHAALADVQTLMQAMDKMTKIVEAHKNLDVRAGYEKGIKASRRSNAFSKSSLEKVKKNEKDAEKILSKITGK